MTGRGRPGPAGAAAGRVAAGRVSHGVPRLLPMDTRKAAQRWADVWQRGWREHDAAAITALYAEGAFWQQDPFREPEAGYLTRVFTEEESCECQFDKPIVDGDQAAVRWSARTRLANGESENLAGVSLLRFNSSGLVVEHLDFSVFG